MARKTTSRIELRRQLEALEQQGQEQQEAAVTASDAPRRGRASAKSRGIRSKNSAKATVKSGPRKRLVWVVYSGSMKEEGRFSYDQRAAAEERIEQLRQKGGVKKLYFIQPVREVIGDPNPAPGLAAARHELSPTASKPRRSTIEREKTAEDDSFIQEFLGDDSEE